MLGKKLTQDETHPNSNESFLKTIKIGGYSSVVDIWEWFNDTDEDDDIYVILCKYVTVSLVKLITFTELFRP